jgi:hypothetical protein
MSYLDFPHLYFAKLFAEEKLCALLTLIIARSF